MSVEASANDEKLGNVETRHLEGGSLEQQGKFEDVAQLNTTYDDEEHEPEIHIRTYFAVAAMLLLNYVQIIALQGPPVVVSVIS